VPTNKVVCHLIFEHDPFDGRVFHKECKSLQQAGYQVYLFVPSTKKGRIGKQGKLLFDSESIYENHKIKIIPYTYNKSIPKFLQMRMLLSSLDIIKKIKHLNPAIIHVHEDGFIMKLASTIKKHLPEAKLVFDFHESYLHRLRDKGLYHKVADYIKLEDTLLSAVDAVVTVSPYLTEHYQSITDAPVVTIPNTQSKNIFIPTIELKLDKSIFWIAIEGKLFFDRGLQLILDAAKQLERPDIRFLVIGDLPAKEMAFYTEYCNKHNIRDRFHITTFLPYQEVASWLCLAKAGLSIYLSKNARIGYPNKLFNYLLFGIPVIANIESGSGKFVQENGIGIAFSDKDPASLVKSIMQLATDKEFYTEIQSKAQITAEIYNWEYTAKDLISLYEKLLG